MSDHHHPDQERFGHDQDGHDQDGHDLGGHDQAGHDHDGGHDHLGGFEEELDAFLSGELEDDAAVAWANRLAASSELRHAFKAHGRLRRLTAELPAELEPERDLFPQIASRLEPRGKASASGPRNEEMGQQWRASRRRHGVGRRAGRRAGIWRQALAAGVGIALGTALTLAVSTGSKGGDTDPGGVAQGEISQGEIAQGAGDRGGQMAMKPANEGPNTFPSAVRTSASGSVAAGIEADFLRARETLWIELLARRDHLPPETWHVVVENLGLLDRVIRELRQALDENPGNRRLEKLLLSNHQRQLDVLHKVTREV